MSVAASRALVGTSGWKKAEWRGAFYRDVAQKGELAFLAKRMPTVEINSTFHGLQRPASFLNWHDEVPEHFVFSVKASQSITHERRLRGAQRELAAFLASGPLLLREKLGPFLWQLPPSFVFDAELIDGFLGALPRSVDEARSHIARHGGAVDAALAAVPDRPLRHSMEVRNASFAQPRYPELLRAHGVAAVLTNPTRWPAIDAVTADFVYVRLGDGLDRFPEGQSDAELEHHAERVRAWRDGGHDVFFYFDDPEHTSTRPPFDAISLQKLVGGESPAEGATLQTMLF